MEALLSAEADPAMRGPFPLLCTPWTEAGELDVDTLVREAEFVASCGARGVIWPTAGEVLDNLTDDEYRRGLDALASRAKKDFAARLVAICPGRTSAEAVSRVEFVNSLMRRHRVKIAVLARPCDDARDEDAVAAHFRRIGKVAEGPVIIQTFNGKSPAPSVELLVKLSREYPDVFGYVKEESPGGGVNERIAALLAAKPAIHSVFSGWGAKGWLYQGGRLGSDGIITQRPAYADVLAYIFERMENGDDGTMVDAYSKLLLMYNLGDTFGKSDDEMRGVHLHVLKKRGVFRNTLTRGTGKGPASTRKLDDAPLPPGAEAEIDARLAALAPFMRKKEANDGR